MAAITPEPTTGPGQLLANARCLNSNQSTDRNLIATCTGNDEYPGAWTFLKFD